MPRSFTGTNPAHSMWYATLLSAEENTRRDILPGPGGLIQPNTYIKWSTIEKQNTTHSIKHTSSYSAPRQIQKTKNFTHRARVRHVRYKRRRTSHIELECATSDTKDEELDANFGTQVCQSNSCNTVIIQQNPGVSYNTAVNKRGYPGWRYMVGYDKKILLIPGTIYQYVLLCITMASPVTLAIIVGALV